MPGKILLVSLLCAATVLSGWQGFDIGITSATGGGGPLTSIYQLSGISPVDKLSLPDETPNVSLADHETGEAVPLPDYNDLTMAGNDWPLVSTRALPYTHIYNNDDPVLVAILDTGIDTTHEDLIGKVVDQISMVEDTDPYDYHGHGTFIAGIIAAEADNDIGIKGIAPQCRLLNVKVADDNGQCRHDDLAEGIIWAVDHGAKILNISIEMQSSTKVLESAIDYAWEQGAIIVAAAGNKGSDTPVFPASYSSCIASTAVRSNFSLAPLANYGNWVDVAAPGYDIYATLPDDEYGIEYGTSFAAAYVSGLAARLYALVEDDYPVENVREKVMLAILYGCRDIGIEGTGRGFIDVRQSTDILASTYAEAVTLR